jgi:hypothetical protein
MLGCVRCGINQNLISHDFTFDVLPVLFKNKLLIYNKFDYFKKKIRESLHSVPIPVCRNCKKLFDKWFLIEYVLFGIGAIEFALSLFFGFGFLFSIFLGVPHFTFLDLDIRLNSPLPILLIFSIIFALFLINIYCYQAHKHNDTNPRSYIRMGVGVVPLVRPQNYPAWIDYYDWLNGSEPREVRFNKNKEEQPSPNLKFENFIYKILKSNAGKAYTIRALLTRIGEQLSEATEKEYFDANCEQILNDMNLKGLIKVMVKQGEFYYVII